MKLISSKHSNRVKEIAKVLRKFKKQEVVDFQKEDLPQTKFVLANRNMHDKIDNRKIVQLVEQVNKTMELKDQEMELIYAQIQESRQRVHRSKATHHAGTKSLFQDVSSWQQETRATNFQEMPTQSHLKTNTQSKPSCLSPDNCLLQRCPPNGSRASCDQSSLLGEFKKSDLLQKSLVKLYPSGEPRNASSLQCLANEIQQLIGKNIKDIDCSLNKINRAPQPLKQNTVIQPQEIYLSECVLKYAPTRNKTMPNKPTPRLLLSKEPTKTPSRYRQQRFKLSVDCLQQGLNRCSEEHDIPAIKGDQFSKYFQSVYTPYNAKQSDQPSQKDIVKPQSRDGSLMRRQGPHLTAHPFMPKHSRYRTQVRTSKGKANYWSRLNGRSYNILI